MPAFLVRIMESRDIVGFFSVETADDLLVVVDECTEPADCEYVEMPVGGIMWTSPAIPVPIDHGPDDLEADDPSGEHETLPWARAELSESWWSVIYGYTDEHWMPFFPDRPQPPRSDPPKSRGPARVIPLRRPKKLPE